MQDERPFRPDRPPDSHEQRRREQREKEDTGLDPLSTGSQYGAQATEESLCPTWFLGGALSGTDGGLSTGSYSAPGQVCVGDSEGGLAGIYRAVITLVHGGSAN